MPGHFGQNLARTESIRVGIEKWTHYVARRIIKMPTSPKAFCSLVIQPNTTLGTAVKDFVDEIKIANQLNLKSGNYSGSFSWAEFNHLSI